MNNGNKTVRNNSVSMSPIRLSTVAFMAHQGSHKSRIAGSAPSETRRNRGFSIIAPLQRLTSNPRPFTALLLLGAMVGSHPAAADSDDALNIIAGLNETYDSNLFRLPDSANPQSDFITTGFVGLRIDKPYAQQRFQVDVTETAYRYDKSSYLNYDALSYRAAWLWHLTPRLSGTISADRAKSLVAFSDTLNTQKDVRTSQNRIFTLDGTVSGAWHVLFGIAQSEQKSDHPTDAAPDFRSVGAEAGVKYLFPTGSSVALIQRRSKGHYINSSFATSSVTGNDDFTQDETEVQAVWSLDARSTVTGRLTWVDRRNETFTDGDFSGAAGRIVYRWTPTAKVSVDFSAERDISAWQQLGATYRIANTVAFEPSWQIANKVILRGLLAHTQSDYRGGVASISDRANIGQIGADWTPFRSLTIGGSVRQENRSSDVNSLAYDDTLVSLTGTLKF